MSSYRFFNIKLLPISGDRTELIGKQGYQKLLASLQIRIRSAHQSRDLLSVSFQLKNDFFFSVLHIKPDVPYGHGKLFKFDKPGTLVDTLTGDILQSVPHNASAHRYEFQFVFDYTRHVIAIQQISGKSPSPSVLIEALTYLFLSVQQTEFPDHYLEISLLTSDVELALVFSTAEKYKRAEVSVSITNADEYFDDEVQETEAEMAKLNIGETFHVESAPKDGYMHALSSKCMAYLKLARKNGNASIRYVEKQTGKLRSYVMKDHPVQTRITLTRRMPEGQYLDAVHDAIIQADEQSKA